MTRHQFMGAVLAAALTVSSGAFAQGGTEAEQEACTPDVYRLCSAFIPNEEPIVACLKAAKEQLSPACKVVFYPEPVAHRRKHRRRTEQ